MVDTYDRKANTTSSLYISSTITSPNVKSIIQAVATILHSQMLEVHILILSLIIQLIH